MQALILLLVALGTATADVEFDLGGPGLALLTNYTISKMTESPLSFLDKIWMGRCGWEITPARRSVMSGEVLDFNVTAVRGEPYTGYGNAMITVTRTSQGTQYQSLIAWDTRAGSTATNDVTIQTDIAAGLGEPYTINILHIGKPAVNLDL